MSAPASGPTTNTQSDTTGVSVIITASPPLASSSNESNESKPNANVDLPSLLKHTTFLKHAMQGYSGACMGCLHVIAQQTKMRGGDVLNAFMAEENRDLAFSQFMQFVQRYTQSCCDDYCTVYGALFIDHRYTLEKAMGHIPQSSAFANAVYSFRTFNRIFQESRVASAGGDDIEPPAAAGPRHLGCVSKIYAIYLAKEVFDGLRRDWKGDFEMAGAGRMPPKGTLSEAEKNLLRHVIREQLDAALDKMGSDPEIRSRIAAMPFVCKGDNSCDENWDVSSMPPRAQGNVKAEATKQWTEYWTNDRRKEAAEHRKKDWSVPIEDEAEQNDEGGDFGNDDSDSEAEEEEEEEYEDEGEDQEEEEGDDEEAPGVEEAGVKAA